MLLNAFRDLPMRSPLLTFHMDTKIGQSIASSERILYLEVAEIRSRTEDS